MNNKFINNNGANLLHTKNKKTQVESQIELLKNQEQAISQQLEKLQPLQKKIANLMNALRVSERVGYQFLNELVEAEKNSKEPNSWQLGYLLKDKVEFDFKFEAGVESFYQLVFKEINDKVDSLQNNSYKIKNKLQHQERLFARIQARRQGKILLECRYKKSIGCLGNWQCDNCQNNYSVSNQPFLEVATQ